MAAPTRQLRELSAEHHDQRADLVDAAAEVAGQMWAEIDPNRIVDSWAAQVPELTAIVSGAQLGVARQADSYVAATLHAQDLSEDAVSPIDPAGFAGTTAEGGPLMSLLTNPVFQVLSSIPLPNMSTSKALASGGHSLETIVRTEVNAAGLSADQVALTAHRSADGYIRQTDGAPCSRCLILSGRFYQWNTGFQRHPRCGCTHVPASRGLKVLDPKQLYDRMSTSERLKAGFSYGDQAALDEGADLAQVVNAERGVFVPGTGARRVRRADGFTTEGTTRRAIAGRRLKGSPRLTPDEILRIAQNRDDALRLLYRNGYLLERPIPLPTPAERIAQIQAAQTARLAELGIPPVPKAVATDPALKMTVADIKAAAKAAGVKTYGTRKADILGNLRSWEVGNRRIPGLPEWRPPTIRPAAIVAPPLGVPSGEVLTGASLNDWADYFKYDQQPGRYKFVDAAGNTPPEGVRVQDLRVLIGAWDGSYPSYVVATGTAWRIDGVSYLIEHGPADFGAPWVSRALTELQEAHKAIPAAVRANKSYAVLSRNSPADVYWQKKFNNPRHTGGMSAGDGHVTVYHFQPAVSRIESKVDSLRHETGHNLDTLVGQTTKGSDSPAWATAADKDLLTSAKIRDLHATSYQATGLAKFDPSRAWAKGVTDYGRSSAGEDYAESVMLYQLGPIATGRRPGVKRPDLTGVKLPPGAGAVTDADILYFRDIYPARAAILDREFPDIAKAQKAEIKALRAPKAPPQTAATARQKLIDKRRQTADFNADTLEALSAQVDTDVLVRTIQQSAARNAIPKRTVDSLVTAARSGDPAKVEAAIARISRTAKVKPLARPTEVVGFDPKTMQALESARPGQKVRVIRPGHTADVNGETVQLSRSVVEVLTPAEIREIEARAGFERALRNAVSGNDALKQTPIRYVTVARQNPARLESEVVGGRFTAAEREELRLAFQTYVSSPYIDFGRTLRGLPVDGAGRVPLGPKLIERLRDDIDQVMGSSSLAHDTQLWRGMRSGQSVFGDRLSDDLTGFEWTDLAFPSHTVKRDVAVGFSRGRDAAEPGVLLRVLAPKGTPATTLTAESELLLGRGLRFRVVADHGRTGEQGRRLLDVEIVPRALTKAELAQAEGRALRQAARETNRLIESRTGTAKLLAEVDELISKGASKATILQRLDVKLIEPEQIYAGADKAIVDALRVAVQTGDPVKLRSALTRAGTKAKIKVIGGKAGAKVKFDPDLMEPVGGFGASTAEVRAIEVENQIRAAYARLARPDEWVGMADLRAATPALSREEFDAAIRRLGRGDYDGPGSPFVSPETNQKALTRRDRAAAVDLGGQDQHVIKFADSSPRSVPAGDIAKGAQVVVVTRGSTLTLPDGKVLQLTKAKVTAVAKPVKAPEFRSRTRGVPTLKHMQQKLDDHEALAVAKKAIDGEYTGGIRAQVDEVFTDGDGTEWTTVISGDLFDAKTGQRLGQFSRQIQRDGRAWEAHHDTLELLPAYQGSGFANDFNANLYDWYRRSGIKRVELYANIDVGGYAWATKGFDFEDVGTLGRVIQEAQQKAAGLTGQARSTLMGSQPGLTPAEFASRYPGWTQVELQAQLPLLDDIARRVRSGEQVTAYELSQLGRKRGQGKGDWWIGKILLMGRPTDTITHWTDSGIGWSGFMLL